MASNWGTLEKNQHFPPEFETENQSYRVFNNTGIKNQKHMKTFLNFRDIWCINYPEENLFTSLSASRFIVLVHSNSIHRVWVSASPPLTHSYSLTRLPSIERVHNKKKCVHKYLNKEFWSLLSKRMFTSIKVKLHDYTYRWSAAPCKSKTPRVSKELHNSCLIGEKEDLNHLLLALRSTIRVHKVVFHNGLFSLRSNTHKCTKYWQMW